MTMEEEKFTYTQKQLEELRQLWFNHGKKVGREEVQRGIKDLLNIESCSCEEES